VTVIGLGQRLLASIIDAAILLFLTIIVGVIVGLVAILLDWATPNNPLPVDRLLIVSMLAVSFLYYVAAWARSGQTVGKAFLGLRVVGSNGQPLAWGKALLRYVGYLVSALVLSLGFLWIAFDPKRQGWHDKFAGSYVVKSDAKFSDANAVRLVPSDPKPGWIWLVVWLVVALIAPAALLTSLLLFGPAISATVTGILSGLF
jgi:uncharacterized RDD family membrane protein YckC